MEKAKLLANQAETAVPQAKEDAAAGIRALEDLELVLAGGGSDPLIDWGG